MRTAMFSLTILAVLALTVSTASAAGPQHNAQVSATLVAQHGHHGHRGNYGNHGNYGHHGPSWGHSWNYGRPHVYRPPVVVVPRAYGVYPYYPYPYNYPGAVFSYRGNGFGLSIGF